MNMQEMSRLIQGLRSIGLTDSQMAEFLLWVESGDEENLKKAGKVATK